MYCPWHDMLDYLPTLLSVTVAGTTGTCLYGVFDGHDGSARASEYAQDKFPADLLYERLPKAQSALDLCNALQLSFRAVERGFFASLDSLLAKRDNIRAQLPPVSHSDIATGDEYLSDGCMDRGMEHAELF